MHPAPDALGGADAGRRGRLRPRHRRLGQVRPRSLWRTSPRPPSSRRRHLLELYGYLKLNRMVEEKLTNLYRQGKVVGGLYRSLGQEACSVGAAYALERGDIMTPLIRNLGAIFVRGGKPRDVLCQYMARAAGPTRRPRPQHPLRLAASATAATSPYLDAGRHDPDPGGRRHRRADAGTEDGRAHLDRRRRHLDGRLPRGAQLRLRAEGARSS